MAMNFVRASLRKAVLALVAIAGIGVPAVHAHENEPDPHLAAVRFVSSDPLILAEIVKAAKSVGWDRTRTDKPGTVTLLIPDRYSPDDFGRLLDAVGGLKSHNFGLQMIDNLGRMIGPDGKPLEN